MAVLHGDVSKVYEVLTKGYAISPVQTASMDVTSDNIAGTSYQTYYAVNLPGQTYKNGYMKKISVTCNNTATLMEAYLSVRVVATGVTTVLWQSFFVNNGEWDLNDIRILDTNEYLITLGNYVEWIVHLTVIIIYIAVLR